VKLRSGAAAVNALSIALDRTQRLQLPHDLSHPFPVKPHCHFLPFLFLDEQLLADPRMRSTIRSAACNLAEAGASSSHARSPCVEGGGVRGSSSSAAGRSRVAGAAARASS
jgi:hypothetical protein